MTDAEFLVTNGSLLAAGPDMLDPNFMHTVVLVCQHSEEGAYGLVVNRPTEQTTDTVLPEHPILSKIQFPIYKGGPVGLDTFQILHRVPEAIPEGVPVTDELWIGGDLEALGDYLRETANGGTRAAERAVRLLVGYAGWSAGQLEFELQSGAWLPAPATAESLFDGDSETMWRQVVRSIGGPLTGMEDQPPDPNWN